MKTVDHYQHGGGLNPRIERLARIMCQIEGEPWPSDSGRRWGYRTRARHALIDAAALAELERLEAVEGRDLVPAPDDPIEGTPVRDEGGDLAR